MNASPTLAMRFEPMLEHHVDAAVAVEQSAYAHPWLRRHFHDALLAGNHAQMLWAGDKLLGYCIAMAGVDEVHLLNITVAPAFQGQGLSRFMLDALALWARGRQAQWLWLEVRVSNTRALGVYEACGFRRFGQRKEYYPAGHGKREDAIVMGMPL